MWKWKFYGWPLFSLMWATRQVGTATDLPIIVSSISPTVPQNEGGFNPYPEITP